MTNAISSFSRLILAPSQTTALTPYGCILRGAPLRMGASTIMKPCPNHARLTIASLGSHDIFTTISHKVFTEGKLVVRSAIQQRISSAACDNSLHRYAIHPHTI